jgi:DNA transformation protein and related proteins
MTKDSEFADYVVEITQSIGPVYAKRMFGGHGVFLDGLMFGLIANKTLYLKADKESEPEFTDLDLEAFSYNKNGKQMKMSYFQAPEEALENLDEMNIWANKAYSAALRAAVKKKKPSK